MPNRDTILEAIRTTAKNNNNVPVGVRAFEQKTGIKQAEWKGIYWARWSDAVKDAGLTLTNTFTTRTDKSILLGKLVPAIRYYGKLPTVAEMRLYKKTTSNFQA